ncbi:hypothetical protein N8766_04110 [bacterium]|nr:hypothetical protein [bacterium]
MKFCSQRCVGTLAALSRNAMYYMASHKVERLASRSRSEYGRTMQKKDLKLSLSLSDSEVERMDLVKFCTIHSVSLNSNQPLKPVTKKTIWNEKLFEEDVCLGQIEESSIRERRNDYRRRESSAQGDSVGSSTVEFRQPVVTDARRGLDRTISSSFLREEWDP